MDNLFHRIHDTLKRNETEMLIRQSGSTRDSHDEKIRSGQSYLYKRYGMESEVFEVRFKKKVSGSMLNQAILKAIKRYPYFNTKLVEKDGDFYIVQNPQSMIAKKTQKLAHLGHISCGYHLIDVTYYDYSVFISFHHALCDGRGVMPFIETLIYYYCSLKYGQTVPPKGVRLEDDPLLPGETEDPFMKKYDFDQEKEFVSISRDSFAIPENVPTEDRVNDRYEVKIPGSQYMGVCKENNATPVILLSLLMSRAIADMYPDYDKPIHANIATDMREALDAPNTFKNCVKSMILPYDRDFAGLTMKEQATQYRKLLSEQRDRDYCRKEANGMMGLFDKLDALPSYEEKQKIMDFFEGMTLNTYIVSYVGQFKLGRSAEYIDTIHLYNSGTTGLGINMISCGDYFVLDFKQNFSSDKYVKAFCAQLDLFDISHQTSGVIPFETPGDALVKREKKETEAEK